MNDTLSRKLLDATEGGKYIFIHYCGYSEENFSRKKFKDRSGERVASAHFKRDATTGIFYYKDFGAPEKATDAIGMYARQQGIEYGEAARQLAFILNLQVESQRNLRKPIKKVAPAPEGHQPGDYKLYFKDFTCEELRFLGPGVTKETCESLGYKSIEHYWYVTDEGKMVTLYSDPYNIIFVREARLPGAKENEIAVYKVYQPRSSDYKFTYRPTGLEPGKIIHGLYELEQAYKTMNAVAQEEWEKAHPQTPYKEKKLPRAVLCSGERDALCLMARGEMPVWLNSETIKLTQQMLSQIKEYVYEVYYLPDCDETGLDRGRNNAFEYMELRTIWLPREELHRRNGDQQKPMKDFRDWCELHPQKSDFIRLLNNARPLQFWEWREKKCIINPDYLIYFLAEHGFCRMYNAKSKEYDYYHICDYGIETDGRIVEKVTTELIRAFLLDWIDKQGLPNTVKNTIIRDKRTTLNALEDLITRELSFKNCTRDSQDFFCQNGVFRVTAEGIVLMEDMSQCNYVLTEKVIPHDVELLGRMFTYDNYEMTEGGTPNYNLVLTDLGMGCKLGRVLFRQSDLYWREKEACDGELNEAMNLETQLCLQNRIFTIGFILHRYKDRSKQWLPILTDWKVGTTLIEKNGRSGKTFIEQICEKVARLSIVPIKVNKKGALDYEHVYDNVTLDTDVIILDEIPLGFNYYQLNDETSGRFIVNSKNKHQFDLDFEQSPKLLCISNYPPSDMDPSSLGRYLINVVGDYYHEKTPNNDYSSTRKLDDEFGMELYREDYPEEDWEKDVNFLMQCEQFYLHVVKITRDKLNPPMSNLIVRINQCKADSKMARFVEEYFIDGKMVNQYVSKQKVLFAYNDKYPKDTLTERELKKELKTCCDGRTDLKFNPVEMCNDKVNRRYKDTNNHEMFYIKTIPKE